MNFENNLVDTNNIDKKLSTYKSFFLLINWIFFGTIGGYYSYKIINDKKKGIRYIGSIYSLIFVNILIGEYILNIENNYLCFLVYMIVMPTIFITRMVSWLTNDLTGKINKKIIRPYYTYVLLYEALFEGLLPFLFLIVTSSFLEKKTQNLVATIIYSCSRFYIEFYKKISIAGFRWVDIPNSKLTLGQVDTIINWVVIYWYITCNANFLSKLFQYFLLNVFFFDINNRITNNEVGYTTFLTKNVEIIWVKAYNKGFVNGYHKKKGKIFKLIYPLTALYIYNIYLIKNLDLLYIFNCFALLNIFERFLNGHVTDYIFLKIYNHKIGHYNYADFVITIFIFVFLIKNVYTVLN